MRAVGRHVSTVIGSQAGVFARIYAVMRLFFRRFSGFFVVLRHRPLHGCGARRNRAKGRALALRASARHILCAEKADRDIASGSRRRHRVRTTRDAGARLLRGHGFL